MNDPVRKSILLVEDEVLIGMDEARQLKDRGYDVALVASGEAAVEYIRAGKVPVDLILMDIDLGRGMDGTDAAQAILRERDIPIVFVSSHTEKDIVEKTEKITSYGYVVKSSGISVLTASIKTAFHLSDAYRNIRRQNMEIEVREKKLQAAVEELQAANEEFETVNGQLVQSERELMKSETFLNSIVDQSPYPMWISDERGTLIRINDACLDLLNSSAEELTGKYNIFEDEILESEGLLPLVRNVFENGEPARFEIEYDSGRLRRIGLKSIVSIVLDVSIFPIRDDDGIITNAVIQHIDITDRKRKEEKIGALLREKDLLVKETFHRVKNSMTVMRSLLMLNAGRQADPTVRTVISDTAGRLQSMIGLYDKLYRSENLNELSIRQFLPPLINELLVIFQIGKPVQTKIDVDDIVLNSNVLMPLGIIINEMITNSLKYAFADTEAALITVTASKRGNDVTLRYGDNGIGLPESVTLENSPGFGLQLIGLLIQQINGSISIDRSRGTAYEMEIRCAD